MSFRLIPLCLSAGLGACASVAMAPPTEETRAHDARVFTADGTATTFAALAPAAGDGVDVRSTSRWAGVLGGAGYHVEVPANWNGKLVMYAHGFAGNGSAVVAQNPFLIRRYLIQNGYAWAASSYSKSYYDVRAGVEDTNALALQFTAIAAANARPLSAPTRTYITGFSMGGHISAAAIEDEVAATAIHKVRYDGAVPMCGVVGDTDLFNDSMAMQLAAQTLAGVPSYPTSKWSEIQALVKGALFTDPANLKGPTATGLKYLSVLKNITGGERPMFMQGVTLGPSFADAFGQFGADGTVTGILNKSLYDTHAYTYVIDGDSAGSAALNASVQRLTAAADPNRLRTDGLRWIPKVNGEFRVPVVSIHTLGDLYVPFSLEQAYQKRAAAKGNSAWLVQRAIRGIGHCDFTVAEASNAFDAMIQWERDGIKPAGDDIVSAATVAAPTFGCTFTDNRFGADDGPNLKTLRTTALANSAACP